ncbi:hypothetical protein E2C01_034018 [Portunus trituberculatus]|uniref:Uncharacterized protein n=1 Tax=Portunus trituberculatus TaxID=210409 RepID=A0A5B7F0C7_PORTR|nr:hypothetical protein [Portunus trituberculatus]
MESRVYCNNMAGSSLCNNSNNGNNTINNNNNNNNNNEIAKYVYWVSQGGMTSVLALCQGRVEPHGQRQ